jgi:hypothetical protein
MLLQGLCYLLHTTILSKSLKRAKRQRKTITVVFKWSNSPTSSGVVKVHGIQVLNFPLVTEVGKLIWLKTQRYITGVLKASHGCSCSTKFPSSSLISTDLPLVRYFVRIVQTSDCSFSSRYGFRGRFVPEFPTHPRLFHGLFLIAYHWDVSNYRLRVRLGLLW